MRLSSLSLFSAALVAGLGAFSQAEPPAADPAAAAKQALADLQTWLQAEPAKRANLEQQLFSSTPLTREAAAEAQELLWKDHVAQLKTTRQAELKAKVIEAAGKKMKYEAITTGTAPKDGYSLFISMHGGGGAPPEVNESQWQNQIKLGKPYQPKEGIYVAPRAPTDTWNLWHESHIDALFDRLIQDFIVLENVNPNRVYILGYSAGGDGVYQLAPRMADRLAAASMMAGHPNETSPLGLRNLPFTIHVGAEDGGYGRNKVAAEFGKKLDDLQKTDPAGYIHEVELHAGKAHWMDLEDRKAVAWMEKYTRNPLPDKIVWFQDDVTHDRFYWLAIPPGTG